MQIEELKNKKTVILGFGREGKDTYKFLRKLFPEKVIGIADINQNPKSEIRNPKLRWQLGKNYLNKLKDYDVIIKSPGIPYKILPKESLKKIITQTDIFFDNCQGQIIGVTGTKGKSTTCSMIYQILKAGGVKTHLIGNIGKPVLSYLKLKGVFVYELSSHQLYNLKKSPHIAVLLNVYPEHLDYYKSFKEYAAAKTNITRYQTKNDYLVYNSQNKIVAGIAKKSKTEPRAKRGAKVKMKANPKGETSSPAKKIAIKGEYYELDRNAARAVGEIFKIPKEKIEKAIENFKSLPHRLELVGTFKEITFYDDALSTIPETAIYALDALTDRVETIFLGGYDRGLKFENLAKRILKSKIKNVILFPTTGEKILKEIKKINKNTKIKYFFVNNMRDAMKLAYRHTGKGKIALLSCASTSFSIFRDYEEKGNLFKKYARLYGKKT